MAEPVTKSGRVWITRTQPEAGKTAQRVFDLGFETLVYPVLEARRLKPDWPEGRPDATVITSHHALDALIDEGPLDRLKDLPLFVVGQSLKVRALEQGFTGPVSVSPDSRELFTAISDQIRPGAEILYLAPRDPATPLANWLIGKGYKLRTCVVYETVPKTLDLAAILNGDRLFVLLHSARAASHLGQQIQSGTNLLPDGFKLDVLTFICISEATRDGLIAGLDLYAGCGVNCLVADHPDEASLLKQLSDAAK